MRILFKVMRLVALLAIFGLSMIGGDNGNSGNNPGIISNDDPKDPASSETPIIRPSYALRAIPLAASNNLIPVVLDSYTIGDSNFYLNDVGSIQNYFCLAITEAITSSITISDTQSGKVSVVIDIPINSFMKNEFVIPYSAVAVKDNSKHNVNWDNRNLRVQLTTLYVYYAEA